MTILAAIELIFTLLERGLLAALEANLMIQRLRQVGRQTGELTAEQDAAYAARQEAEAKEDWAKPSGS